MFSKLKAVKGNSFLGAVLLLASGSSFGQFILIASLPILTRLYNPQEFSALAVFVALLAILSSVACLRYEVAIPLPKKDEDAVGLVSIALAIASMISCLVFLVVLIWEESITELLEPQLDGYLSLLPVGILLFSFYNIFQFWATRKKRFKAIAKTKIARAVGGAGIQVAFGLLGAGLPGLIFGQIVNAGAGMFTLAKDFLGARAQKINRSKRKSSFYLNLSREYSQYPKYSTLDTLANTSAIQLPILIISSIIGGAEVGLLLLATKIMQAPIALIGGSISQVFLAHAAETESYNDIRILTRDTLGGLVKTGVGPLILFGAVAPNAFSIVFGDDWSRAGELVAWLTPWFIFQLLASPISMIMHVKGKQPQMLVLTLFGLATRLGCVFIAIGMWPVYTSEFYAVSGGIFYFTCLLVFASCAGLKLRDASVVILSSAKVIVFWITLLFVFLTVKEPLFIWLESL